MDAAQLAPAAIALDLELKRSQKLASNRQATLITSIKKLMLQLLQEHPKAQVCAVIQSAYSSEFPLDMVGGPVAKDGVFGWQLGALMKRLIVASGERPSPSVADVQERDGDEFVGLKETLRAATEAGELCGGQVGRLLEISKRLRKGELSQQKLIMQHRTMLAELQYSVTYVQRS